MAEGSGGGAAHAFRDGIARVAAAPAVLAGTIAVVELYGAPTDLRHVFGALLLWAFLSGGILDRYARRRPTRAHGFFGACGAHFGAMLRLGFAVALTVAAFHLAIGPRGFDNPVLHETGFGLANLVLLIVTFAQVRVAVEDRRSSIGALRAGTRFIVRNPASLGLYVLFMLLALAAELGFETALRGGRISGGWLPVHILIAIQCAIFLAWLATAVSLFQARLAHAGYTAAPEILWPDSPAAEAIASAPRAGAR